MDTGTPACQECHTQGSSSWIPATPFRPVPPIYIKGQANWLRSEVPHAGCSQAPQSNKSFACFNSNWCSTSASQMVSDSNNVDPLDRWKNVSFADLLALSNATSGEHSNTAQGDNNGSPISPYMYTSTSQTDSHQQILLENDHHFSRLNHWTFGTYDRDTPEYFSLGKMQSAFAPITPYKATSGKRNQVSELQNSCTDDKTNEERAERNREATAERVDSNIIQYNKDLLKPVAVASVAAASTRFMGNHVPDEGNSCVIDLNRTPRRRPKRIKVRPKVAKERKHKIQKQVDSKDPTGKRKKGSEKDSTSSPAEAAGESIDQKTVDAKESCRQTLNFDLGQPTERQSIYKSASDLASEETKAFYARGVQSNSTTQLHEGIEVTALKPETPKPVAGKRKYEQKKGPKKNSKPAPAEGAGDHIDLKALKPKKSCRKTLNSDKGKPRDADSACKSTSSKENPTGKSKRGPKKRINKYSYSSPSKLPVEYNELTIIEPTRKSCRRALNFDMEVQHRDEESTCKSSCNLYSGSEVRDFYGRGIQSKSAVQLGEGIELTLENTQAGTAYDLTRSVNQMLKDYMSLPEGQETRIPLSTERNPRRQNWDADVRKENDWEGKGQGADNLRQDHTQQVMMQIDTQTSPRITNESKCNTCTVLIEQGNASRSKRKHSNPIKHTEASSLNLAGVHYHTLQAYQIPWVPQIYKKKRTEKGQNSATSSTSSSVTATKDVTLQTTCSQGNTKTDSSASKTNNLISAPQSNDSCIATTFKEAGSGFQDKQKNFGCLLALNPTERLTKKRSRSLTRVRDLASLTRIALSAMQPTYPSSKGPQDCDKQQIGSSETPCKRIEPLVEQMRETLARSKCTKKRSSLANSAFSNTNESQKKQNFTYQDFSGNSLVDAGTHPELRWTHMFCIDAIIDQFNCLDINREISHIEHQEQNALVPYRMRKHEQNALVLYSKDGTIVPVQRSIDIVKKQRPRPKVELDDETTRVWKLLLENINSEGIDGTNEENTKWWEEERRVFHGRVDSFIARMHLVQGDRRFSKWKGSVVDSVVGVFLTQNVSDHLSSSAYMSLAARFPLKSKSQQPCFGEGTSPVPVPYVPDPEDTVEWTKKTMHQPACDQNLMILHDSKHNEEKEVVSSNESLGSSIISSIDGSKCKLNSCRSDSEMHYASTLNGSTTESTRTEMIRLMEGRIATNNKLCSQSSLISSESSMDSSIAKRTKSSFVRNSKAGDLTSGHKFNSFNDCSFVELLQMAVLAGSNNLHQVYDHGNGNMSSDENLKDEHQQFKTMEYENQRRKVEDLGGPKEFLGIPDTSSTSANQYLIRDSVMEVAYHEMLREETGSSGTSAKNNKTFVTEPGALTPKCASQTTGATKLTICTREAPRSPSENKETGNSKQGNKNITAQNQSDPYGNFRLVGTLAQVKNNEMKHLNLFNFSGETSDAIGSSIAFHNQENTQQQTSVLDLTKLESSFSKVLNELNDATSKPKGRRSGKDKKNDFDWDSLRRQVEANGRKKERPEDTMDSLDWEAVRCANVNKIAETIKERGMNNMLAERIKDFLNRLVREHGSTDLEWLRDVQPDKAKEYLLSIWGLGLKSVECVRLLTLQHLAFPVDTNVGRIAVRLGWVPLQPLPESLQLHLLELYPVLESIQKYLWPRLCKLDQRTLYELHYQMITFGKVFCTKSKPNCNACPMRGECRHFASAFASSRLALPGPEERSIVSAKETRASDENPAVIINQLPLPLPQATEQPEENQHSETKSEVDNCEPIIEEPSTPEPECIQVSETDIEDTVCEDPDEIPTIKLNMEEFTQTLQNYMQDNMELQEGHMSKALVALTAEVASIPMPKLKNVSRLRTEHQVYELPDSHPLLEGLEKREPDDPGRYLLAIWTPGETANSIQPPEKRCSFQEHDKLCNEKTCFACNSVRESQSHIVRGTLLIPCRTAMRGSFPLNGTYFQVNEVFADHDSSWDPINVPREWIWNLPRRTVYFGTSVPTIFKGLTTEGIQHCFWRGYVCVRGFDRKTRAPRPLMGRLHFPASKLSKTQGKANAGDRQ